MIRGVRMAAAVVVLLAGGAFTGCDDDAPKPESTAVPSGLRSALTTLYEGDHADDRTMKDATCVVDRFLDRADPAEVRRTLAPTGRVPTPLPPFSRPLAEAWTDGVFACTDFADSVVRAQVELSHGKVPAEPFRRCLDAGLSTAQLRAAYLATLMQSFEDPALTRLQQATRACVDQARPGAVGR